MENKCCSKCRKVDPHHTLKVWCLSSNCPCHTSPKEEVMEDCQKCGRYICKCEVKEFPSPKVSESDWRTDFDNRFWLHRVPRFTKQSNDIKDFISSLLSSTEKRVAMDLLKEVENGILGKDIITGNYYGNNTFSDGYRTACKHLSSKIKSKYEN